MIIVAVVLRCSRLQFGVDYLTYFKIGHVLMCMRYNLNKDLNRMK